MLDQCRLPRRKRTQTRRSLCGGVLGSALLALAAAAAAEEPAPDAASSLPEGRSVAGFRVAQTLRVGKAPHGIRFSGDGRRAYVVLAGEDRIAIIDLEHLRVESTLPAGKSPLDLVATRTPGQWLVTQFLGESVLRIDEHTAGGSPSASFSVGKGPSLFTPKTVADRSYVACEFADELAEFDTRGAALVRRHPTCKQPYPADVTSDGVLAFVPCRADGSVAVIDLLNQGRAATPQVGVKLEGGELTSDGVSYVAASGGSDEVVYLNTASYTVTHRVSAGIGPRPFAVAMTRDGRYGLINNAGGATLSILDVVAHNVIGRLKVGRQPIVVRMHPDGRRALVANEISGTVDVIELPVAPAPRSAARNQVLVLGTLHDEHRSSQRYSLAVLADLIRAIRPDYVLTEIPPNRFDRAKEEFQTTGTITEPRVKVFPEYVDVLFPLSKELPFAIIPTSAWTLPMHTYRNAALKRLAAAPERAAQWKAYQEAEKQSAAALKAGGAEDDPRYIHSDAYDAALEIELRVYATFEKDLGPGGWNAINAGHYENIARVLDSHRGQGKRFLITYGAGHKGWFLRKLRGRDDIELLDVARFLPQAQVGAKP